MMNSSNEIIANLKIKRQKYYNDLLDFLLFWEEESSGCDFVNGGFHCDLSDNEFCWFQGRGLWTWSKIYTSFPQLRTPKRLQFINKTKDFILNFLCIDKYWNKGINISTKLNGKITEVVEGPDEGNISTMGYGIAFCAEGLLLCYEANQIHFANNNKNIQILQQSLYAFKKFINMIDDSNRNKGEESLPSGPYPGIRTLAHHMIALRYLTQIISLYNNNINNSSFNVRNIFTLNELETLAKRMIDCIINKFYSNEYGFLLESLNYDYTINNKNKHFFCLGHAIECLWMVMYEAMRIKDCIVFDKAAGLLLKHIVQAWDTNCDGGIIISYYGNDKNFKNSDDENINGKYNKVLWPQSEAMIGCLMAMEYYGLDNVNYKLWKEWYNKIYNYVQKYFLISNRDVLKGSCYKMGGDRWVEYISKEYYDYGYPVGKIGKENYHIAREFIMCIEMCDRIIKRDGNGLSIDKNIKSKL
eukprot:535542_1